MSQADFAVNFFPAGLEFVRNRDVAQVERGQLGVWVGERGNVLVETSCRNQAESFLLITPIQ